MASMVKSFALNGIDGYPVDIEVKTFSGMPSISVIGMGDQAVKEAAERVHSAIDECGYTFPQEKIVISLAPGDKRKRGSHYDLAMALALIVQSNQATFKEFSKYGIIGELALDGSIRTCKGILPMIIAAKDNGINDVIIPSWNYTEAKAVKGVRVHAFGNLQDVVDFLEGREVKSVSEQNVSDIDNEKNSVIDFADVKGQADVVDAVVLAAAGGHNMLMIGEPGCGKTMIASRIPTILPTMTEAECLEVTKIHSVAGVKAKESGLIATRPFRAPHHNVSLNALVGGGANALPGEVSLAHNGVLFLDEIAEFSRRTLDALRQPIENKTVSIARVNGSNTYPANFMFVAAMNPCPCGFYPSEKCRCSDYEIMKYRGRISGPIMDRIDIQKEIKPVGFFDISKSEKAMSSEELRKLVEETRHIQQVRYKDEEGIFCNAQMTTKHIQQYCSLDDESRELLKETSEKYGYSARVIHKLLRLSRTAADLRKSQKVEIEDVEKVLTMRDLDKSNSNLVVVKAGER